MNKHWMDFIVGLCLAVLVGLGAGCGGGGGSSADDTTSSVSTQPDQTGTPDAVSSTTASGSLTIPRSSLPLCKIGIAYENNAYTHSSVSINATGASGFYSYTLVSGSLPQGLSLKTTGVISGTANANNTPGLYSFVVKATSLLNSSKYGTQTMTLRLMQPGSTTQPQPYSTIQENPRAYYVHQDAALCSATAYYIILKYYGDNLPGAGPTNVDLAETIPTSGVPVLTSTSKIATYLLNNIQDMLYSYVFENSTYNFSKDGHAYYACIQFNSNASDTTTSGNNQRATIFEKDIVPFLQISSPVFIHLMRPTGYAGHFITLIGYDAGTDEILYLNPNNTQFDPRVSGYNADILDWSQVIQRLPRDTFIKKAWYVSSGYLYNARWDGRWIGFTNQ